ncbi:MAG: hypothetical protein ABI591_21875 [Kofleriaceae bacterium]
MAARIALVVVGLTASTASAQHHHDMAMMDAGAGSGEVAEPAPFDASVQLIAASYSTLTYQGDYEGAIASLGYSRDRYMVGASLGTYRILLNGLESYGIGDLMLHAGATLVHAGEVQAGVVAMVSIPTGDELFGLGMGHTMVMPSAFGVWSHDHVTLTANAGYTRALGQMEANHDHGVWPLVEPMNMSEISWGVAGDYGFGHGMHAGARAGGGHPIANRIGHERVIGALRVGWGTGRVDTAAEIQTGLVGDPFTIRGLLETALHF